MQNENVVRINKLKPLEQFDIDMRRLLARSYDMGFQTGEEVGQRRAARITDRHSDGKLGLGFVFGFAFGVIVAVTAIGFFGL